MNKSFSNKFGFSLIELLVVIAIIAILSAVVINTIGSSKSKSRDAKRISDLAQLQLALEQYFDKNGVYPASTALSTSLIPTYISTLPLDPSTRANYYYNTDTNRVDYVIQAGLERPNDITSEGLVIPAGSPVDTTIYGAKCGDTAGGVTTARIYLYCVGPK